MWTLTVGLVNGKHRYLTAETFGFKINSNGQALKRRQQWTIEPFPENSGPDGSMSSSVSVSSQCPNPQSQLMANNAPSESSNESCIMTLNSTMVGLPTKASSNGSSASEQEACGEEHENVAIKSHLNKYLAVDSFGNVTCDSEEKTESARFTITICSMSQGRSKDEHIFWAFKNVERGYYLGTTSDGMVCCTAKMPKSRAELWHLHLQPARGACFFALKSLGRKRYARVAQDDGKPTVLPLKSQVSTQVQLDATMSWGPEMLFQFRYFDGGRYSILTSDCRYLTNEGKCIEWTPKDEASLPPDECLFTLEYHSGFLAFRDAFGHYLAAAGRSSVLRSRSIGVSRDELFIFESAPIQVSLKATFNNRWVSIRQGLDLTANQSETVGSHETFQLTHHKHTGYWSIMTYDGNFWTITANTSTLSVCKPGDYGSLTRGQFKFYWSESGATFSLKFITNDDQERWICARKSGQLYLATGTVTPVKFIMRFQNRHMLNLRPVEGCSFVGVKANGKQLEAAKTSPDPILIEYKELPNIEASSAAFQKLLTRESLEMTDASNGQDQEPTINIFNVRLNKSNHHQSNTTSELHNKFLTELDDRHDESVHRGNGISHDKLAQMEDSNNNNCVDFNDLNSDNETVECVESGAAPSVASIINSFSNARIGDNNRTAPGKLQPPLQHSQSKSVVMKLASSFELQQVNESQSDTASVTTACSSDDTSAKNGTFVEKISSPDQIDQNECCYLKLMSSGRYLVAGENDSSVVCDAMNKARAQTWILELRSHNSVAIRASDIQAYLQLGTNSTIHLSRCEPKDASLWEF